MMITRTHLPRRTFLRSAGATLALPLLEGMIPAFTPIAKTAAKGIPRLGYIYSPNGMMMQNWTPVGEGATYEFSSTLSPLAPYRDRLVVLTGLNSEQANARPGEGVGDHSRGPGAYLTGVHIKKTEGKDLQAGVSADQLAARHLGGQTQLNSMQLALQSGDFAGACDFGYSCAYSDTVSWSDPYTPLPMENNPRAVFRRMFGVSDSTDPKVRAAQFDEDRSILDSVTQDVSALQKTLGARDRVKLTQYLEAVRDIELRIKVAEAQSSRGLPDVHQPPGIPATFEEHIGLMYDLLTLAFQIDLTRVFTFMIARELSLFVYPLSGVREAHHSLTHYQNDPVKIAKVSMINQYHMKMFATFLERLKNTPDGESNLLDNVMIVYGCGISDGDRHYHNNLPILLTGGGAGQIKGGRHLVYPGDRTPLANLHMTLLQKMSVPAEQLGDSTGTLQELSGI
jgi:hypothetical protein